MNNNQPIISIIVPVYNAALFLEQCLTALLKQTYPHLQIICIDDGSTDGSAQILDQYAAQHACIQVTHQKNMGTGTTRNNGLREATGTYVMFCDADDTFEPTMCEQMLNTLLQENVDVVMCDCHIVQTDQRQRGYIQADQGNYFRLSITGKHQLTDQHRCRINSVLWDKIFKKSIIDQYHITFPPSLLNHEDAAFIWQYLAVSSSYYGLNQQLYRYMLQNNSLMTELHANPNGRQKLDLIHSLRYFLDFLGKHHLPQVPLFEMVLNDKLSWFLQFVSGNTRMEALQLIRDLLLPVTDRRIIERIPYLQLIQQGDFAPFAQLDKPKQAANNAPAPASSSNTAVTETMFAEFITQLSEAFAEQIDQSQRSYQLLMEFYMNMTNQLSQTATADSRHFYRNMKEITHIQTHFPRLSRQDPRLIDLLKGLDSDSQHSVIRLLQQMNQFQQKGADSLENGVNIFNDEEQASIKEMATMFTPYILHVNSHYHQYKKAILPADQFQSLPFYFNYGIDKLTQSIANKTIIDIGTHLGDSAIVFQQLHPKKIVIFEDNTDHIDLIQQTIHLNHINNTEVISPNQQHTIEDTVDGYVNAYQIDDIGLIKINVPDDLMPILSGTINTITTHRPTLIIHIDHSWHNFLAIKPYIESLNLGYRFTIFKPVNGHIIQDTLLIAEAV